MLEPQQYKSEGPKRIDTAYYSFRSASTKKLYVRVLKENIFGVFADNEDYNNWSHLKRRLERLSSNDPMNTFYDLIGETPENTLAQKEKVFSRFPYKEYLVDDEADFFSQFKDFLDVKLILTDQERIVSGVEFIKLHISPNAFDFVNSYRPDRNPILGLSFYNVSIGDYWDIRNMPCKYPDGFVRIWIRYQGEFTQLYEGDNIFHPEFLKELLNSDEFDEKTVFFPKNSSGAINLTQMRKAFCM